MLRILNNRQYLIMVVPATEETFIYCSVLFSNTRFRIFNFCAVCTVENYLFTKAINYPGLLEKTAGDLIGKRIMAIEKNTRTYPIL